MGVDLKVLASHFRERRDEFLPTATLRLERDDALFSLLTLESIPPLACPLPEGMRVGHYEDVGLVFSTVDRGGQPLTFTTPAALRQLAASDLSPWNRAVLAFLIALPEDTRLVLYWC